MRRRMTRAGKSALIKILLLLIIVIAVTVGGLVFVRRKRLIEEKYENTILELQTRINAANRHIYCAATDLKAGTVLGADCLVETEVLSDRWGYITEEDFGKVLLVDIGEGTEVIKAMIAEDIGEDGVRELEYDWIEITSNIEPMDYVDVRILYPDGTDYIVLSKKQVRNLSDTKLICDLWNSEEEILLLDSACVDAYLYEGTKLYVTRYIFPEMQEKSTVNYTPSTAVTELIKANPNIVSVASEYLSEELRKKQEERIKAFLAEPEAMVYYDRLGLYAGKQTAAQAYAEDFLDAEKNSPGAELPDEYGGKLWD